MGIAKIMPSAVTRRTGGTLLYFDSSRLFLRYKVTRVKRDAADPPLIIAGGRREFLRSTRPFLFRLF